MSFLQSPTQLTPQQILNNTITTGANQLFQQMIRQPTQWFNLIWNNPNPLMTPDVTWAALGTNAVSIRQAFLALQSFVNNIAANSLALTEPSSWTITQNSDGSITCSAVQS